jgi:hypothetical protein
MKLNNNLGSGVSPLISLSPNGSIISLQDISPDSFIISVANETEGMFSPPPALGI